MKKGGKTTRPFRYDLNKIPYDYTVEVTNRFKGLDLVDSAWRTRMEICITVQEVVTKTIPKKKKCKRAKWLSEDAVQVAEKRREAKDKGERGNTYPTGCTVLEKARRDKKAFLSEQCKEVQEGNRMGKTRDLFKKMRHEGNI